MSIARRQFFYHENGSHDEKWFYLARDTETGRVFVVAERCEGPLGKFETSSWEIPLEQFLSENNSTAKSDLLRLIGSLVPEPNHA